MYYVNLVHVQLYYQGSARVMVTVSHGVKQMCKQGLLGPAAGAAGGGKFWPSFGCSMDRHAPRPTPFATGKNRQTVQKSCHWLLLGRE